MNAQTTWFSSMLLTPVLLALALSAYSAEEAQYSVSAMPPSVVKTVPQAGDTAVDPALKEIRVTFSKNMLTNRMWAVCQVSKDTFPQSAGQTGYVDNRTCVVPVKLEPGKTYVLWFNRGQYNSFRDAENHPSVPYLLVFQTRK